MIRPSSSRIGEFFVSNGSTEIPTFKFSRVKFKKPDPFLTDLRDRVFQSIENRSEDHIYANTTHKLKGLLTVVGGVALFQQYYLSTSLLTSSLLACSLMFIGILLIAGIAHDASHLRFFRNRKANKWVMRLVFVIVGLDGNLWGLRHLRSHHPMTNIPGSDCDTNNSSMIRMNPYQKWNPIHRFQWLYFPILYLLIMPHAIWAEDFSHLDEKHIEAMKNYKLSREDYIWFFTNKVVHLMVWLVFPVLIGEFSIGKVLFCYAVGLGFCSYVFVAIAALNHYSDEVEFLFPDEGQTMPTTFSFHQVAVNVDWSPRVGWITFLFGGANNHVAHHLVPDVHSRHLDLVTTELNQLCETRYPEYNYKGYSFFGALYRHAYFLYRMSLPSSQLEVKG